MGPCAIVVAKGSYHAEAVLIASLRGQCFESMCPDKGKEFASHVAVTEALGVEFYFAPPNHPWQGGHQRAPAGVVPQGLRPVGRDGGGGPRGV